MPLSPEAIAYQHALAEWRGFRSRTFATGLLSVIRNPALTDPDEIAEALRVLPAGECRPVAFTIVMKAGGGWSQSMLDGFLDEFLPNLSSVERHTLDATVCHRVTIPEKLPATIENFPSRIWQRALAHQRPARLQTAAFQATDAMMLLLAASGCQEEEPEQEDEGGDSEVSYSYRVPIGDLDSVFDLVGIPPASFDELKDKVINKILTEFETGNLRLYEGQGMMVRAWRDGDSQAGHASVGEILAEAIRMREEAARYGGLKARFRTMRLGRFLLRLGFRREAMRCARAIANAPWEHGWQMQALQAAFHTRIRNLIIKPGMASDRWLTDPALACSCMSMPLWLKDGVCRLPELIALFEQAREFPWLYPQLHQIFQWHLALAEYQQALREVTVIDPEGDVGLATPSPTVR